MSLPVAGAVPSILAGSAAPVAGTASAEWYGLLRWIGFAAYAVLVGAVYLVAVCWPEGARLRRVRGLIWGGWTALSAATVGAFLLYGPYIAQEPVSELFDGGTLMSTMDMRVGRILVLRMVILGLVAAVLFGWLRMAAAVDRPGRVRRAVIVVAGAALIGVTWSLSSHSAVGSWTAVALPADTAHLVAGSTWFGGLLVLASCLLPAAEEQVIRVAVPRFSRTATVCVAVVVGTGVFQAWREVDTPADLFTTGYGETLTGKVVVVVVLLGFGAASRSWVRRRYLPGRTGGHRRTKPGTGRSGGAVDRFRGFVLVETGLAMVVLVLAALLSDMHPAHATHPMADPGAAMPSAAPGPPATPDTTDLPGRPTGAPASAAPAKTYPYDDGTGGPAGRGLVAVHLEAGTADIGILGGDGKPREVVGVRADIALPERQIGPQELRLTRIGPGVYAVDGLRPAIPGRWQLHLVVQTSSVDSATVTVPLTAY